MEQNANKTSKKNLQNCIRLDHIVVVYEKNKNKKNDVRNWASSSEDRAKIETARPVIKCDSRIPLWDKDGNPIRMALIGESGSGKTTLVNLLLGNIVPKQGEVLFGDVPLCYDEKFLRKHRASIGFVSQGLNGTISYLSLLENVARPAVLRGYSLTEARDKAKQALKDVRLDARLWNRFPNQVSGGELQRALIAKTIVQKPQLLICDEPTSALDHPNAKLVVETIMKANVPTLIVTHDPALIAPYMNGISLLYNGDLLNISFLKNDPILRTFSSVSELYASRQARKIAKNGSNPSMDDPIAKLRPSLAPHN